MKKLLTIVPLVILLCFNFSCKQKVKEGITEEEARTLLYNLLEVMKGSNMALIEEIMDPECVLRYPILPEPIVGIEAFKVMVKNNAITFTDFKGTFEELIVKGDRIWSRYTMSATNTGPLGDIPATGKKFHITGIGITRVKNEKILEDQTFWNVLDLYQQLGFTLTPPQPPEQQEEKK